ncbi:DUF2283 domain-containing protein [Micromonospora sp. CPCC 205711]|uniref:DUF2283 domain-containing protein n=1 Tax=Micromonospora sp. CPCC 205547 TaxID=3122400 RepID=UPI002FEED22F
MYTETRVALVCTYDSDADAAYIYLDHPIPTAGVQRMVPVDADEGMYNLDLNPEGHVVGLEILDAGKRLPPMLLRAILNQAQEQAESE